MKKRIMLLIMLIICVSLVNANPKSVRVQEMQPPQDVTTEIVDGGALTASTQYYYKVVAVGPGNSFYSSSSSAMVYMSPPSDEVTNTTNTTYKSIKLCWEKNASAQVWMMYRTKVSGDYDVWKDGVLYNHVIKGVASGARMYGFIESQLVVDGTKLCYTDDGDTDFAIPLIPNGIPAFYIEGGTAIDPITPSWLYNWSVNHSLGHFWKAWNFSVGVESPVAVAFEGSLIQDYPGSVPLYFEVPQFTYFLHKHGKLWFDVDSSFVMGTGNINDMGSVMQSIHPYAWYSGSDGNMSIYNSIAMGAPEVGYTSIYGLHQSNQFHWYGDTGTVQKLYYSIWDAIGADGSFAGRVNSAFWEAVRNTLFIYRINLGPLSGIMEDLKIDNYISTHYAVLETTIKNSEFINPDEFDLNYYNLDATGIGETQVVHQINIKYANDPPIMKAYGRIDRNGWTFGLDKKEIAFTFFYKNGSRAKGVNVTAISNQGYNVLWYDLGATNETDEAIVIGETDILVEDGGAFAIGDMVQVMYEVWDITNIVGDTLTVTRAMEGTYERPYQRYTNIFKRYDVLTSNSTGQTPTIAYLSRVWQINRTGLTVTKTYTMDEIGTYWDLNPINFTMTAKGYQPYTMSINVTKECESGCGLIITLIDECGSSGGGVVSSVWSNKWTRDCG